MALPKKITGDDQAIAQIKKIAKERREYFVFLIDEARSNTDHVATFTGDDGNKYRVRLDLAADQLEVSKAT